MPPSRPAPRRGGARLPCREAGGRIGASRELPASTDLDTDPVGSRQRPLQCLVERQVRAELDLGVYPFLDDPPVPGASERPRPMGFRPRKPLIISKLCKPS